MRAFWSYLTLFILLLLGQVAHAGVGVAYYEKITLILGYSNVGKQAQVCVFKHPKIVNDLAYYVKQKNLNYRVVAVDEGSLMTTACQVVYFPESTTPTQNRLIHQYLNAGKALLSINDDPYCEGASAFCLQKQQNRVKVAVNLMALGRSKVKVNPIVLDMLAER